jgi:hypothetical protein
MMERRETLKSVMSVAFALSLIVTMFAAVYAEDSPDEIHDKELRLAEEMATIARDSQDTCDLMGDRLGRFMSDHAAFMRRAQTSPPEQDRPVDSYRDRSTAARARMVEGLLKCQTNAKVTAAMAKHRALAPHAADDVWLGTLARR